MTMVSEVRSTQTNPSSKFERTAQLMKTNRPYNRLSTSRTPETTMPKVPMLLVMVSQYSQMSNAQTANCGQPKALAGPSSCFHALWNTVHVCLTVHDRSSTSSSQVRYVVLLAAREGKNPHTTRPSSVCTMTAIWTIRIIMMMRAKYS